MVSLDSSLVKSVMLKVIGDGGDAKRMFDDLEVRVAELKSQMPIEMATQIDRAHLQAQAVLAKALVRAEMEKDPVKIPVKLDVDRNSISNWVKFLSTPGGWGSIFGGTPGAGQAGASGGFGGIAKFLASPAGLLAGAATLFTASPLITTLLGGLVGGGAAAGAFKLASNANTNLTALQTTQTSAQQALTSAQNQQKFYPSAANAAAVTTAQTALTQANQAVTLFQKQNAPALGLYNVLQNIGSAASSVLTGALTSNATRQVQARGPGRLAGLETVTEQIGGSSFISGLEKIMNQIPAFIQSQGPELGKLFRDSLPYVEGFVKVLEGFLSRTLPALDSALVKFKPYIIDVVHLFNGLSDVVSAVIRVIGYQAATFGKFAEDVQKAARWAGSEWDRFGHDMANWAQVVDNIIGNVINWFENLPGKILRALGNLGNDLYNVGKDIVGGLIRGMEQVPIVGSVISMGEKIVSLFRQATGSHSPSVKAMAIGRDFTEGFRIGLTQSALGVGLTVGSTGGGGGGLRLQVDSGGGTAFEHFMVNAIRNWVRIRGGGSSNSVQKALGQHA